MREYFYTNAQLCTILSTNSAGQIDWELHGFSVNEIIKYQSMGNRNGKLEILLPINNRAKFNLTLGNLINLETEDGEFYKVITEEVANDIKAEFEALNEIAKQGAE